MNTSSVLQVFVVDFKAPAPKTQAAFFFFATELLNPCMWSTDSDFLQSEYKPGNDKLTAPCYGCMVRYLTYASPVASPAETNCPRLEAPSPGLPFGTREVHERGHPLGCEDVTLVAP